MAMSRMARGGMMGRLRKRMSPEDREAMGSKYSGEFNRAYANATQSQSGQDTNQAGGDMMQRVRSQLGGLNRAGQGAVDAGRLRPGDSARAMGDEAAADYAENEARPAPYGRYEDGGPRPDPVRMGKITEAARIRNAKVAHAEPDADDMGGPPDNDADDAPRRGLRMRRMRGR